MKIWVLSLFVVFVAGCATTTVQPELPLEGCKVAILPFSFGERRLGESIAGAQIARLLMGFLRSNIEKMEVVSLRAAEKTYLGKRIEDVDWKRVAFLADGADYVIVGHIRELRSHIRGRDVGVYNGYAEVYVYAFDRDGNQSLAKRITARYPYREISAPIPMIQMAEDEFLGRLMARTALLVSRLFYKYKVEDE